MQILVLDDENSLLESLQRVLSDHNHEVHCADNAESAVQLVKGNRYDFILLDYKMPEKDGLWFMRNAEIPRETKVLLITAFVNREVIKEMFGLGVSGYLIKPFGEDELLHHLSFHADKEPPVPSEPTSELEKLGGDGGQLTAFALEQRHAPVQSQFLEPFVRKLLLREAPLPPAGDGRLRAGGWG